MPLTDVEASIAALHDRLEKTDIKRRKDREITTEVMQALKQQLLISGEHRNSLSDLSDKMEKLRAELNVLLKVHPDYPLATATSYNPDPTPGANCSHPAVKDSRRGNPRPAVDEWWRHGSYINTTRYWQIGLLRNSKRTYLFTKKTNSSNIAISKISIERHQIIKPINPIAI